MTGATSCENQESSSTTSVVELSTQTPAAYARRCLRRLNLFECIRLTTWAGENPGGPALHTLSALLKRPNRGRELRSWMQPAWIEMRLSAVNALRRIGTTSSAQILADTVMYDATEVRRCASEGLIELGPAGIAPLLENLNTCRDWPVEGMVETINTLGAIGHSGACSDLVRVLLGVLPENPNRSPRTQTGTTIPVGFGISALILYLMASNFAPDGLQWHRIGMLALGMAAGYAAIVALPMAAWIHHTRDLEAARVYAAAGDALVALKSVRTLRGVLEVASSRYSGRYPVSARNAAVRALIAILPELGPGHTSLLSATSERKLTDLFASDNNELVLAAVRALEFVGSGQSCEVVERLVSKRPAYSDAGMLMEIRLEAECVLPVLLERKRQEELHGLLLRPSEATFGPHDELVRAVSAEAAQVTETLQLLRPSDGQ